MDTVQMYKNNVSNLKITQTVMLTLQRTPIFCHAGVHVRHGILKSGVHANVSSNVNVSYTIVQCCNMKVCEWHSVMLHLQGKLDSSSLKK